MGKKLPASVPLTKKGALLRHKGVDLRHKAHLKAEPVGFNTPPLCKPRVAVFADFGGKSQARRLQVTLRFSLRSALVSASARASLFINF
jgi:hypothetical protein